MFRSILLYDAFRQLALPREWTEFATMATPYNSDVQMSDDEGWPIVSVAELGRYKALWARFAGRLERKLWAGEWIAEGLNPTLGPRFVEIDVRMWEFLRIVPMTEEADGGDIHFTHLRFTSTSLASVPSVVVPQSQTATLRRQLTDWIRRHAENAGGPMLRDEQRAAARAAFKSCVISDNLFRECRRDAKLEEVSVQKGRPKVKGLEK